jgi:hypothetical protein
MFAAKVVIFVKLVFQISSRMGEDDLVEFLSRFGGGAGASKVKFDRRRAALDDDDEDDI